MRRYSFSQPAQNKRRKKKDIGFPMSYDSEVYAMLVSLKNLHSRTVREIVISYGSSFLCIMKIIHGIKKDENILIIN